ITTIIVMPVLTNPTEIQRILGTTSFYQRYFHDFASTTTLMCKLLKNDEEFKWMDAC
ncbi:unnamed protein product, partial [Sphagnum troendelagicum]